MYILTGIASVPYVLGAEAIGGEGFFYGGSDKKSHIRKVTSEKSPLYSTTVDIFFFVFTRRIRLLFLLPAFFTCTPKTIHFHSPFSIFTRKENPAFGFGLQGGGAQIEIPRSSVRGEVYIP